MSRLQTLTNKFIEKAMIGKSATTKYTSEQSNERRSHDAVGLSSHLVEVVFALWYRISLQISSQIWYDENPIF